MSWEDNELAIEALTDAITSSGGWLRAQCPFCPEVIGKVDKRRSFGCNKEGYWHCFRCTTAGKITSDDWAPLDDIVVEEIDVEDGFDPPEDFTPLWCEPGLTARCLAYPRDYLINRGLTPESIRSARIGACLDGSFQSRIVVPILSVDESKWIGYAARDWTNKQFLRYRYPPGMKRATMIYQQRVLLEESDKPVLVVEGVFDALPYFGDAVALLGKPSPWQVEQLKLSKRPLAITLDGDAWQEGWSLARKLQLYGVNAGSVKLPAGQDPNSVDKSWLIKEAAKCVAKR